MGLVYWSKLDDTNWTDEISRDNGSAFGTVTSTSGKIANAATFSGQANNYIDTGLANYFDQYHSFSLSCWVKVDSGLDWASKNGRSTIVAESTYNGSIGLCIGPNGTFYFIMRDNSGSNYKNVNDGGYSQDVWYHLVGVYDHTNRVGTLYIDGIDKGTLTSDHVDTFDTENWYIGGGRVLSGSSTERYFEGQIDDVRIYDHALSPKEVKLLSQAKVAHWNMNYRSDGTENHVTNPTFESGVSSWTYQSGSYGSVSQSSDKSYDGSYSLKLTRTSDGGECNVYQNVSTTTSGKTYTFSAYVWCDTPNVASIINYLSTTQGSATHSGSGQWERLSYQFTSDGADQIRLRINNSQSFTGSVYFDNIQLEEKQSATEFVDESRTGTLRDCSGYGNDASLPPSSSPPWVSDAGLGNGSYDFNGDNQYISLSDHIINDGMDITLSAWIYYEGDTGDAYVGIINRDGPPYAFSFYVDNSNYLGGWIGDTGSSTNTSNSTQTIPQNEWSFVALTYQQSDKSFKLYYNGDQVHSATLPSDSYINSGSTLFIGRWSSGNYYFDGKIDDIQVYATALSADDISELYHARASLDNVGNLYANEFEEPHYNYFGQNDWSVGYWNGDVEQLGAIDGYKDVGYLDAVANAGYEDAFTLQFVTTDFPDYAGAGNYLYMIFWAKWNEIIGWEQPGTWVEQPSADDTKYQRYILKSDGQNARDEYFRLWYGSSNETAQAYIADPVVLKEEDYQRYKNEIKSSGIFLSPSFSELGPTDGLVAYWKFDGNLLDYSGEGNDCSNDGCVLDYGLGQQCYRFDGTGTVDGTVEGANIDVVESITNTSNYEDTGVTYSFWLNVDTDAVDRMALLRYSSTIRHIEIYSSSKHFRTEAALQNGYSFGSGNFPDDVRGVWSHFVIVFANNETNRPVRWYQNGALFYTGSLDGGSNPGTEYFSFSSIGRSTGTTSYTYAKSFDGRIQDFRIYNRALTAAEIKILYQMTNPDSDQAMVQTPNNLYVKNNLNEV